MRFGAYENRQLNRTTKWFTKDHVETSAGDGTPIGLLLSLTVATGGGSPSSSFALGSLGANFWVTEIDIHVTEAFNGGSDAITIGYDADPDAYSTAVSLTSVGVQTIAVTHGVDTVARIPKVFYTGTTNPSTGKTLIILEHFRTPTT